MQGTQTDYPLLIRIIAELVFENPFWTIPSDTALVKYCTEFFLIRDFAELVALYEINGSPKSQELVDLVPYRLLPVFFVFKNAFVQQIQAKKA